MTTKHLTRARFLFQPKFLFVLIVVQIASTVQLKADTNICPVHVIDNRTVLKPIVAALLQFAHRIVVLVIVGSIANESLLVGVAQEVG